MDLFRCLAGQHSRAEIERLARNQGLNLGNYLDMTALCLAVADEPNLDRITRAQLNTYARILGFNPANYRTRAELVAAVRAGPPPAAAAASAAASAAAPAAGAGFVTPPRSPQMSSTWGSPRGSFGFPGGSLLDSPGDSTPGESVASTVNSSPAGSPAATPSRASVLGARRRQPLEWRPFPLEEIPNTLCGYIPGQLLGQGAYGRVYAATREGRNFAIKVEDFTGDRNLPSSSALTEAAILAQTRHPNLIRAYDAFFECDGINNGRLHLVLDQAKQGNMLNWLRVRWRTPIQRLRALAGILDGLKFMHSQQLIHADLKPGNILFRNDTAIIADFGLSVRNIMDRKSPNVQSLYWRSPEIFELDTNFTTSIDMWSVGALIWDLFGPGEVLFLIPEQDNYEEALYRHMLRVSQERISLPAATTGPYKRDLEELMTLCFRIDPGQRITAEDALQLPLFRDYVPAMGIWITPETGVERISLAFSERLNQYGTELDLSATTVYLALYIANAVLAVSPEERDLLALGSLAVAAAVSSDTQPTHNEYIALARERITETDINQVMADICDILNFQLFR